MPVFKVKTPDGSIMNVNAPEGATERQAIEFAAKMWKPKAPADTRETIEEPTMASDIAQGLKNVAGGAVSGAAQIGATILSPIDWAARKLGIQNEAIFPQNRRAAIESGLRELGAEPESLAFKGGQMGAEIAGTAGLGGAIAPALKFAPRLASAVESGGFQLAKPTASVVKNALTRGAGGAIAGGATAGLVNPEDFTTGAAVGAAMPTAVKAVGKLGNALISKATPEVATLAAKAKDYGIDIPADRLVDSKTLNAMSASLNYVPFSGRTTTEERLASQINKAVSQTFGQNSDNVTDALRKAGPALGSKFDQVLKNNSVRVDDAFMADLAKHADIASRELEAGQAKIIQNQIDEIMSKAQNDLIDGQAAYNIKRTLDRISKQNSPVAHYASDLRISLMDALNRSLGPEEAANFAKTRMQYGNMLKLEKLAPAGAEGEISMGRLANLRDVRDPKLRDLIDIAAQFGRTREAPHGAAQRVVLGALAPVAAATGQIPIYAGAIGAAAAANRLLNSQTLRNAMLRSPEQANQLRQLMQSPGARSAAVLGFPQNQEEGQ